MTRGRPRMPSALGIVVMLAVPALAGAAVWRAVQSPAPPVVVRVGAAVDRVAPPVPVATAAQWDEAVPTRQTAPAVPTSLQIPALGIDAPIVARGVRDTGELDLPADAATAAWYSAGPVPGDAGSAVVAAHVDYGGRPGVFFGLRGVLPGARVVVNYADGSSAEFEVREITDYPKATLPVHELFRTGGPPTLALVTCGGEFDRVTRRYRDNTVVTAVPVASRGSP